MKPADLLKLNKPPCILIFGPAGTGKTALGSQLKNAYGLDFDDGMFTAATLKDKFFDVRQQLEFDVYKDEDPFDPKQFPLARKKLREIIRLNAEGKWDFNGLFVDSLTGLCRASQLYNQYKNYGKNPFAKMLIQDWGSVISDVEEFLTLIRAVRVPAIVTAHVDMKDKAVLNSKGNPIVGQREILAQFPSSATNNHGFRKLMWLFDEVWYSERRPLGAGKASYWVIGNKFGTIQTRTRSSFGKVRHDEIGLEEVLKLTGYNYEQKSSNSITDIKTSK